jgi:hypothetical protein
MRKNFSKKNISYSLYNYAFNIRNHVNLSKLFIAAFAILFSVAGAYYAFFKTPLYQTSLILENQIFPNVDGTSNESKYAFALTQYNAAREMQLIQSPGFLSIAKENFDPKDKEALNLLKKVEIKIINDNSPLLILSLEGMDPLKITHVLNLYGITAVTLSKQRKQAKLNELNSSLEISRNNLHYLANKLTEELLVTEQQSEIYPIALMQQKKLDTLRINLVQAEMAEQSIISKIIDLQSLNNLNLADIQILQAASVPDTPISHSPLVILLLSLILGLSVGYILALAFD